MPVACKTGCGNSAVLKRPKTGDALCKECFYWAFETEVHHTITTANLFRPGEFVAVAASGGKDSTVLAHVMKLLNERYSYGLRLTLLSIDEGISGYRDDSLDTVRRNRDQYQLSLTILSYRDLYGWSMDEIVRQVGLKNNCTFCGVFRRQALDRGAAMLAVDQIVTGHNADDIAETIIMNVLRGDVARLGRCVAIKTASEGGIPRSKPFKYTYEKEIVMYAYYKKLDYFSTECIYSPNAYRGYARAFLKDLESVRASSIMDILHSGEWLQVSAEVRLPERGNCSRCGYVSSQPVCKACVLLQGLNQGRPRLGIGKSSRVWLQLKELPPTASIKKASGSCQKSCTGFRCRKSSDNAAVEEEDGKVTVDAEVIGNLIPAEGERLKEAQCRKVSTDNCSDSASSIGGISSAEKLSELSLNI